jgi:GTP1/Obg family GTP-binding protein
MRQQTIFTCALCGAPLTEKPTRKLRKDAIYCSGAHRSKANAERKRVRKLTDRLNKIVIDLGDYVTVPAFHRDAIDAILDNRNDIRMMFRLAEVEL